VLCVRPLAMEVGTVRRTDVIEATLAMCSDVTPSSLIRDAIKIKNT